jgi:antitoxin FitA
MSTITVALTEEQKKRLEDIARQSGATVEEVARVSLEAWLDRDRDELLATAKYLLNKNAELYQRLA